MGIRKLIQKALNLSCVYFTVITACYIFIHWLMNISEDEPAVESLRVLLYFFASVLFAVAHTIYSIDKINSAVRVMIHYLIYLFTFYTCFLLPVNMRPDFMFTGTIIFTIIYSIVMGIIALFRAKLKKNREVSAEYQRQFTTTKKK